MYGHVFCAHRYLGGSGGRQLAPSAMNPKLTKRALCLETSYWMIDLYLVLLSLRVLCLISSFCCALLFPPLYLLLPLAKLLYVNLIRAHVNARFKSSHIIASECNRDDQSLVTISSASAAQQVENEAFSGEGREGEGGLLSPSPSAFRVRPHLVFGTSVWGPFCNLNEANQAQWNMLTFTTRTHSHTFPKERADFHLPYFCHVM